MERRGAEASADVRVSVPAGAIIEKASGSSLVDDAAAAARRRRGRRTQAERSAAMRHRIQVAAIDSLEALGYADTTFASVASRAGVSVGALQHHYPSKALLVASALEALTISVVNEAQREGGGIASMSASDAMDQIWKLATAPPVPFSADVRVAARTDPALRQIVVEAEAAMRPGQYRLLADVLGPELAGFPEFDRHADSLLATIRGLTMLLHYEGRDPADIERVWEIARDDFLSGLRRAVARLKPDDAGRPQT